MTQHHSNSQPSAPKTLQQFNSEYLNLHVKKEDLFWRTYMGVEKDSELLKSAEETYKSYISEPKRIQEVREALTQAASQNSRQALEGWLQFFSANAIESEKARKLQTQLIEMESELFKKRAQVQLTYIDKNGKEVPASTNVLSTNLSSSDHEQVRKSSHDSLLKLEQLVMQFGYLELVKKRNEFARELGFTNFFDYKSQKNERLTFTELSTILTEFEQLTRESCFKQFKKLAKEKGDSALLGHNLKYAASGDTQKILNPYFPFQKSLENWCRSFAQLGIRYRQAKLTLDLIDRQGKYENGFMHGPQPCYFDEDKWNPARINFTSNATPNQVGSGRDATMTLFHEGGHAAHFSNITLNAPCFSQEFPPTSMAYAETQSMFCDSVIRDADWLKTYAKDIHGQAVPEDLIEASIVAEHPFRAFQERGILVVPIFEMRLYSLPDAELTSERVTTLARQCEKEILGVECGPRPLMAIPHLLNWEGSCSYQGYLLAHMAVYQTRAHFLKKYGFITDNPQIGSDLSKAYWAPGNSISHSQSVLNLTGERFSGRELADLCNLSPEELWKSQKLLLSRHLSAAAAPSENPELEAEIHIVHGAQEIANNLKSMPHMWSSFEDWVKKNYGTASG